MAAQNVIAMQEEWESKLMLQESTIKKLKSHLSDTNQRGAKLREYYTK